MWNYIQPVNAIFGEGEAKNLGRYMEANGLTDALMIADPFLVSSGLADQIANATNGKVLCITADVEPNPTLKNVNSGIIKAKEVGAKCVVALGGGSAIDCAKSVAVCLKKNISAEDLVKLPFVMEALPIIAIPTTAGTASEVTAGAVLSDSITGTKLVVGGPGMLAKIAIVDPVLTYSCPSSVTSRSGMDVIAHALDVMCNIKANPVTDALAIKAAKKAFTYLETAVNDGTDKEARKNMSEASLMAGFAFALTGTTGAHACSYALTSEYHLPHGEACAFTLDKWFSINAKAKPELEVYAREMGFESVKAICEKICDMKRTFGFKVTLKDIGATEQDINFLVESAMASSNMVNNIVKIDKEELTQIFMSLN